MRKIHCLVVILLCLMMAGAAGAQGVGASGDIRGTVTDPSGGVVANATVTATNVEKGFKRAAATDEDGNYAIVGLLPATYDVSVARSGFQTAVQKGVVVTVGQRLVLDFHLTLSGTATSVEVTAEPPVVETTKASESNTISEQQVRDLPINRRDYLTFTMLAPGVADSTRLAADQDFRVKQTPHSGLSFYGSNGRGNSVTVDGGEANDDSGGVRLTVSQEAVQEFQINRSNYAADLGGASGASMNIVTKSGGNLVHGSLFGLFRNDGLDAANPFAITQPLAPGQAFVPANPDVTGSPTKDSLTRYQFGGSLGGPIRKDKTFLFGAFEGLLADAENAVPLFTSTRVFRPTSAQQPILTGLAAQGGTPVPCLTGQPALPSNVCAGILQNILTINPASSPLNAYVVNQFELNGGLFPYTTRQYLLSARLDHQFSDRNQLFLRYSFGHNREESPDVQSLVGFSAGSKISPSLDNTLQASWFHQFSHRTINEARAQVSYFRFDVIPNAPGTVGINIPGYAFLNSNIFLPSRTIMRRYEMADNLTVIRGRHSMKFGFYELIRGNHTESDTFLPGRFQFGNLPGGILSPCLQVPAACGLTAGPATISSLQSLSLGLPQFYQQGFGSPIFAETRPWTAFYAQDSWSIAPNFVLNFGARYELDSQRGVLNTDTKNIGPRVSFAWDPFKDHKTVVRGGYGIFFSPIYMQIPNVIHTLGMVNGNQQIAQVFVPLTGQPGNPALTSAAIFQTLFAQGTIQCTTPSAGNPSCIAPGPPPGPTCTGAAATGTLCQFGIAISHSGAAPLSVFFGSQPDYRNPYSQQAELGIEREIGWGWSVSLSGVYVHTIGLPTSVDQNLLATTPTSSITLANGSTYTYHNWKSPACAVLVSNPCFANLITLQNNIYSSKGAALYEGGILEIKKQFTNHFSVLLNYTFSKAWSTSTDFNSDFAAFDETNLGAERGLADFDQRHKFVFASVLESPWQGGSGAPVLERIFAGFQLAPIVRYTSGHPFNLLAGTDVNGDRHSTNDRPLGARHNSGIGPDFTSMDLRITRRFKLNEKVTLQIIAEGFNIFNTTNFASVNNVVDPSFLLPTASGGLGNTTDRVSGSAALAPSSPLGFTSALAKRQLQFGVRLTF